MTPNSPPAPTLPEKKSGRPQLLDPVKCSELLAILSLGCGQAAAAEYVGCSVSTIYRTARRHPDFAQRLGRARNQAEISFLKNIHTASDDPKYWRAAAWALERSHPGKYGPDRNNAVQSITPDQLQLILAHFARRIIQQVPVDKYRKKIIASVATMTRELGLTLSSSTDILVDLNDAAAPKSMIVPELTLDNRPLTEAAHDNHI
jgi:hypothetical protein